MFEVETLVWKMVLFLVKTCSEMPLPVQMYPFLGCVIWAVCLAHFWSILGRVEKAVASAYI